MKKIVLCLFLLCCFLTQKTSAKVEINGISYCTYSDYAVVTSKDSGYYTGNIVIPDTIVYEEKTYPVRYVGNQAFAYGKDLKSVTIGDSVIFIERYAFMNCSGLTSVVFGKSVEDIAYWAFANCSSLTEVQLPSSVKEIRQYAFSGCTSLKKINIPAKTILGRQISEERPKVPEMYDDSYYEKQIGKQVFANCLSLEEVDVNEANEKYCSANGVVYNKAKDTLLFVPNVKAAEYVIPTNVKCIGYAAFATCKNLTSLTIPENVTSIGDMAFCCWRCRERSMWRHWLRVAANR